EPQLVTAVELDKPGDTRRVGVLGRNHLVSGESGKVGVSSIEVAVVQPRREVLCNGGVQFEIDTVRLGPTCVRLQERAVRQKLRNLQIGVVHRVGGQVGCQAIAEPGGT